MTDRIVTTFQSSLGEYLLYAQESGAQVRRRHSVLDILEVDRHSRNLLIHTANLNDLRVPLAI